MSRNLVVFCPGYSGLPPKRYNPLLKRLEPEFDTVSINYRNFGRGDITDTAGRVLRVIRPLREKYDHISFIGHSMGGLVARKALVIDPSVGDSLITIGTPHRGTQAAMTLLSGLLGGWSVNQMRPGSLFLSYLDQKNLQDNLPILTITGQWDFLVPDGSIATGDKDIKNVKIPRGEHTLMLASTRVYGEIYCWLKYEVLNEL